MNAMTTAKMKSIKGLMFEKESPSYTTANNPKRKKIAPTADAMMKKNDFMSANSALTVNNFR